MKLTFTKSNFFGLIMGLTFSTILFVNQPGAFVSSPIFTMVVLPFSVLVIVVGLLKQPSWKKQPMNYRAVFFTMVAASIFTSVLVGIFAR